MATKPLEATTEVAVATKATKPSRGRGGKNNFPQSTAGIPGDKISTAIGHMLDTYRMPKVKDDNELIERLDQYFVHCKDNGVYPTIEAMALYCGYTRGNFWEIEVGKRKGFTASTADIIKKGKEFIAAVDAEMVILGEMNFTTYIFRSKNYYGMQDKVEHVLTPGTADEYSRDDIASRYMIDGGDGDATT